MISFETARLYYFDRAKFDRRLDARVLAGLSRIGAYVWRQARSSLRYTKKSSSPGRPPAVHRGSFTKKRVDRKTKTVSFQRASPLRELLRFAVMGDREVVIGPPLGGPRSGAPRVLERGGQGVVREVVSRPAKTGRKATRRQAESYRRLLREGRLTAPRVEYRERRIAIAARPFMAPALAAVMSKLPMEMKAMIS
jgi:hypothetical protein